MKNRATYEVEVEVQVDSERVETHKVRTPPTIRDLADAEDFALEQANRLYPDATSMKVVCTTDYCLMAKWFPGL